MNLLSDLCLNQLNCQVEKGRDRHGSYFLGLKIRGKGDEDVPLFVTGLSDVTGSTKVNISDVTDNVMDTVTAESTDSDECDSSDGKIYNLLNVETQLELVEQYTTAIEKELKEQEKVENNPSQSSQEQDGSTASDRLEVNDNSTDEPSPAVTNSVTNDEGLNQGVVQFDFDKVMKETDDEMKRLNWSRGDGKDYLVKTYGVKSRHRLSDVHLVEFWNYLKQQ